MLTIGEFSRLSHVSPRMLRHYDDHETPVFSARLAAKGLLWKAEPGV